MIEEASPTLHAEPHAVPVVVTKDDHTFELDEEALASVLLDERVRDKKVSVELIHRSYIVYM